MKNKVFTRIATMLALTMAFCLVPQRADAQLYDLARGLKSGVKAVKA